MDITTTKAKANERKPKPKESELGFGKYFTDHLFLMDYEEGKGWFNARIEPYKPLPIDPAALMLNYGQQAYDGFKAYRWSNGGIYLFRPHMNLERLNRSAQRLCIPEVESDLFSQAVKELVLMDRDWIPHSVGTALYVRPFIISTEPGLGVRPANQYLFYIVLSPVGAYYKEGFNPTRIYVEEEYVRAVKGGVGVAKTAANYAASLYAAAKAQQKGYTQVLWLDAIEHKYCEEVGTSNIFFLIKEELVTPPLAGTILPGVTRDSVIQIVRGWDLKVSERPISIDELVAGCQNGTVKEIFATGTAAIVSPVGEIGYRGKDFRVGDGRTGPFSKKLYEEVTGIQYGLKEDTYYWCVRIDQ